jgi:hypothetical protein
MTPDQDNTRSSGFAITLGFLSYRRFLALLA